MNATTTLSFRIVSWLFLSCLIACTPNQEPSQSFDSWTTYSGDPTGSKFVSFDQITADNVGQLKLAWKYECGDARTQPATTIECNPIIIDGTMYLSTPGLKVVALDAVSGEEKWRFDPYEGGQAGGVNRGMTYWAEGTDQRILYVAGAVLYAIDAQTGALVPDFGSGGKVDLYQGLGREVSYLWVTAATPGIIFEDVLILGSTLGEGPAAAAPGHIRAFDVRTGEQRWIFHTIPQPGQVGYDTWPEDAWKRTGGTNAWGGFTLDEKRGWVFCGTGSPSYDHWGGDRIGQNLFGNCVLALNARTGECIWHYQVVHHDIWDYDIPCPPNLVQVKQDGKLIDAVAQPTKMGHLFVLDRETGEPIFPVEEVPVAQSEIPGEESWPTQPFPPEGLRYAQQRFTEAEVTRLTPEATQAVRERLKEMDTGDVFLPPSQRGAVTLPQFNGGTDWGGAAYDPNSRTLFVNASNEAEWIGMLEARPPEQISAFDLGEQLYRTICSACHGFGNPKHPGSPSLAGLKETARKGGAEHVQSVLMNGKGSMPKFAVLSQDERDGLVAFLLEEGKDQLLETRNLNLSFANDIPWIANGHRPFRDPEGFPVNQRPWGTLTAIDLDQGEINWQVPLGTYPELEARGEAPTGTFNMGGPLVTGGGVVFIGASMDERFHAYDANSGELLWEYQLDAGGYATPASFEVAGKQYVVIAGGGGGKPETRAGDAYYCFALE